MDSSAECAKHLAAGQLNEQKETKETKQLVAGHLGGQPRWPIARVRGAGAVRSERWRDFIVCDLDPCQRWSLRRRCARGGGVGVGGYVRGGRIGLVDGWMSG